MRHYTAIIFFFCVACYYSSSAQNGTIKIKKPAPEKLVPVKDTTEKSVSEFLEIFYGYKLFRNEFIGRFNTITNSKQSNPIKFIGIGGSGPVTINRGIRPTYAHMFYLQVLPQPYVLNDSIYCKVTGFVYSLAWGMYFGSENSYISLYAGFNTGRLRFYDNELVRQKNPFFSPKLGIHPKFCIHNFTFGVLAEAEYDISKTSWRKTTSANNNKASIQPFNQTGITALIAVSYKFTTYVRKGDLSQ